MKTGLKGCATSFNRVEPAFFNRGGAPPPPLLLGACASQRLKAVTR